jgi:hypothetical protein
MVEKTTNKNFVIRERVVIGQLTKVTLAPQAPTKQYTLYIHFQQKANNNPKITFSSMRIRLYSTAGRKK